MSNSKMSDFIRWVITSFLAQRVSGILFSEKKCKMKKDKETPKWEKGPASDSRFFLSDFEKFPGIHKNKFSSQKKQNIILPIS